MQPGIAFPRALLGETLDFSEPQPNRCWFLESHQKQAFMLLSFFFTLPLSLSDFHAFSLFFLDYAPGSYSSLFSPFSNTSCCLILCPFWEGQHLSVLICVVQVIVSGLESELIHLLWSLCQVPLALFLILSIDHVSSFLISLSRLRLHYPSHALFYVFIFLHFGRTF